MANGTTPSCLLHNATVIFLQLLSILDGWWIEGCLEGITGWAIGRDATIREATADEADSLYHKLEEIGTLYYQRRSDYGAVMRGAIALNGSFFNTQRMLSQYVANAYFLESDTFPAQV